MLVELLKDEFRRNSDRVLLRSLYEEVKSFMTPFEPGKISLEITESFFNPTRSLVVYIENMGRYQFPIELGETIQLDSIVLQLSEIFRESRIEPEEHIILGLE